MRRLAVPLDLFVAVSALFGGVSLALDPSGGRLGMPLSFLAPSPFDDYLVPGLFLAGVVGGSALLAGIAHLARRPSAWVGTFVAGVILVGWIVAEVAFVRAFHPLQVVFLLLGGAQVALAGWVMRRTPALPAGAAAAGAFLAHGLVAFVGLSAREDDFSRVVARAFRKRGVAVVPVNPRAETIDGERAWPAVSAIPDPPRAALLMVPPAAADEVVRDCITAGVRAVWFHRGAGAGSASPEAVQRARDAGLDVVTDTCPLMLLEPDVRLHTMHARLRSLPG